MLVSVPSPHQTQPSAAAAREILNTNTGFDDHLEAWVPIAQRLAFVRTPARLLTTCPDCDHPTGRVLSHYVYYSTRMALVACPCGLIYSTGRIDPGWVFEHFQRSYKDERYFVEERRAIFDHLARHVARLTRVGGTVLDVGGAKGHLMRVVRQRRPDLELLVNDVSPDACAAATAAGFETHCGDATAIPGRYDTVVVSDALYYVPELAACWGALQRLVKPGGWLVLRIPNRSLAIQAALRLQPNEPMRVDLPAYNPEHLYLFTRPYLRRRLSAAGFTNVQLIGSPFVGASRANDVAFRVPGPLALTSSVLVLARAVE